MKPIIRVENLRKQYRIGDERAPYATLRERINELARAPLRRLAGRNGGAAATARTIWALDGVSFDVHPGEVVGIIGRNGSGKSTLLKTLSLITEPTAGAVELYGRFGSLLEVGTGFHPELSGRENIFLNGAILGMKRGEINGCFDEIVEFADIGPFVDTPVKRYSSGMYLRLAFAVAAHLRTEILLIDEVLAVGDTKFQKKCLGKVKGVAREGRTVLFVSHNMGAVTGLCQRALWLDAGRLRSDGETREVVSGYFAQAYGGNHQWERPPTDEPAGGEAKAVRLRSVRVCQADGAGVGVVPYDQAFTAEVEYEVKESASDVSIILRVVSESGTIVFSSRDTDAADSWRGKARPQGLSVSACHIPGKFLRPGRYFLTVGVARGGEWIELNENVLLFEVSSVGNPLNPERLGVVTPILEWSTRAPRRLSSEGLLLPADSKRRGDGAAAAAAED